MRRQVLAWLSPAPHEQHDQLTIAFVAEAQPVHVLLAIAYLFVTTRAVLATVRGVDQKSRS